MTWCYRVVKTYYAPIPGHEAIAFYSIRSVYTDPLGYSAEPSAPVGESLRELRDELARMLDAAMKPVLEERITPEGKSELINIGDEQ